MPSPTRRGCLTCARVERRATRCCRSCGTMGQCQHQRQCHHQGQRDQQEEGPWREANICDSAQTQAPAQAATKPCAERTGVWRKVSRSTDEIKNRRKYVACFSGVIVTGAARAHTFAYTCSRKPITPISVNLAVQRSNSNVQQQHGVTGRGLRRLMPCVIDERYRAPCLPHPSQSPDRSRDFSAESTPLQASRPFEPDPHSAE